MYKHSLLLVFGIFNICGFLPQSFGAEASNYLNLFIARSPYELDWKTPSTLATTLLENSIAGAVGKRKITLGHVDYELKCEGEEKIYAGMHYLNKKEGVKLIFKDQSGLGLLFHNMAGRIDTKADIDKAKLDFLNGKTSIISFRFNKDRCLNLKKYISNYLKNGEQYNYGLNNNPFVSISKNPSTNFIEQFNQNRNGIPFGAGCTAFVVSSLQELGVTDLNAYNQWFSQVRVPEKYIGQYSDQIYHSFEETQSYKPLNQNSGKQVSVLQIIRKAHRWANADELGKDIVYYSPNKMFSWVESVAQSSSVGDEVLSGKITEIRASSVKNSQQAYFLAIDLK